jgi:hypothetical protein
MALARTLTQNGGAIGTDTITGVSFGTASADRWLVFFFSCDAITPPSGITIGGVSAAFEFDGSAGAGFGLAYAKVPTGTSGDLNFGAGYGGLTFHAMYAVTGAANIQKVDSVFNLTFSSASFSINVEAGGVTLGIAINGADASAVSFSSGLTDDSAYTFFGGILAGRNGSAANASTTSLSCSFTGATAPGSWAISFEPDVTGTMAATEGADSASMTGTVTTMPKARPVFRRRTRFFPRKEAA